MSARTKRCCRCGEVKALHCFGRDRRCADGLNLQCRECKSNWNRIYRYGIGTREYLELVAKQDGKCALCDRVTRLQIDHCHETGRVRGLLCHTCNKALGAMGDTVQSIRRVLMYLEQN